MLGVISFLIRAIAALGVAALTAIGVYSVLPDQVRLIVPFTSQAPGGSWAEPWQNACEEASIIMIDNFYKGNALTKEAAATEILTIFDVKEKTIGSSADESMATIAQLISNSKLNWTASVVDNPSIEQLKQELVAQRPIIVPVYAPDLVNPYYAEGGPDYHVVVLVGYDEGTQEFITHDPGTQRGEDFRYGYQEFYDAISDFLELKAIGSGPKRVLFTAPVE